MFVVLIGFFCLTLATTVDSYPYNVCHDGCYFKQSLDSPFVLPEKCNKTTITLLCQVDISVDYTTRIVKVKFGSTYEDDSRRRSITDNNKDLYDNVEETTTINKTQITTNIFYSCTLGNRCEEAFMLSVVSKLIKRDYTRMQQALIDALSTSSSSSSPICSTSFGNKAVTCNGTCNTQQTRLIDFKTGNLSPKSTFRPSCGPSTVYPAVTIYVGKMPISERVLFQREVSFYCSHDFCNSDEQADRIENIVTKYYQAFYQ